MDERIDNRSTISADSSKIEVMGFNAWYCEKKVLSDVNLSIMRNKITAFIGPSGCGKTTLLRSMNLMSALTESFRSTGSILLDGHDLYTGAQDSQSVRKKVGMVFQEPNPFPTSIRKNMELPIRENNSRLSSRGIDELIVEKLKDTKLYEEVMNRMHESAFKLSGGQQQRLCQQRLCIARALTIEPEVILLDEPCSALDPVSTSKIETLLTALKPKYTIVIVTHNLFQALRIADYVAFFYDGRIEEQGLTQQLFITPNSSRPTISAVCSKAWTFVCSGVHLTRT